MVSAGLTRSALSACPDSMLRVYASSFASSSLDGPVELSEASFENVRIAVNEPTRVLAYDSSFLSNQLCDQLDLLALQGTSRIKCSGCADELVVGGDAASTCAEADNEALEANFCEAWKELEALPVCQDDIPLRPHRVRN